MGGQNHQPTRPDITPASAWLSRQIGEGIISIQEANNHLENAIMIAMNRLHVEDLVSCLSGPPEQHLTLSSDSLQASLAALDRIDVGFARLFTVAAKIGYMGNPLARSVRTFFLDNLFNGHLILPCVNTPVWNELIEHIENHNILGTLQWERSEFNRLIGPTRDLIAATGECLQIASSKGAPVFADSVERNVIPFRQYYSRVFSLWNHHNAMFLYSALIMTELFYRASGYPSLADFDPAGSNSRVA